jgi:putative nucleotidyltransferase with HDIG domain
VARAPITLTGLSPKVQGLRWQAAEILRLGRLPKYADVVLDDLSVSPRHAELVATRLGWVVRDLGSKQGTLLNGNRLGPGEHRLRPDDTLQLGSVAVQVSFTEEAEPPAPAAPPQEAPATPPGQLAAADGHLRTSGSFLTIQNRVQHSWEQALEVVAQRPAQPTQGKHLLTLLRTSHHLTHLASLDELLQSILDDVVGTLDAQRGSIVLADEAIGNLQLRAVSAARRAAGTGRLFSKTLADRCFGQGESLLCCDVSTDSRLLAAGSILHGGMSSVICALLRSPRRRLGVLHLDRGPLQEPFTQQEFFLADAIAASVSVGIESALLVARQRDEFLGTITALARTVEMRDQYTADHTQRVTDYALMLAEELGLAAAERHHIQIGTPLHDIGKIGVEDAILRKPGKLTDGEFELMKAHTLKGAAILAAIPALQPIIPIVRHHHERWDGRGYPDRLAGDQISQLARIVAVADAFDAMTSDRPYRKALGPEMAFGELRDKAGTHFDPVCVKAFLKLQSRVAARLK